MVRKKAELEPLPLDIEDAAPAPIRRQETPLAIKSFVLFGRPANAAEWSRWGKAMLLLEHAQVSPDELPVLARAFILKFPDASVTLMAIATRPGELRKWVGQGMMSRKEMASKVDLMNQIDRAAQYREEE